LSTLSVNDDITCIARRGIGLIDDPDLREALDQVYRSEAAACAGEAARGVFDRLTSRRHSVDRLCRFIRGWQSTHGTALYVSALMIRLGREAGKTGGPQRLLLYQAAAEIGEVIPEDTGVDDVPHSERFAQFANQVIGDDRWKGDRYCVRACEQLRTYVKQQRLQAPIEDAILTTAASENWNSGEYTYFSAGIVPWLVGTLGLDETLARESAKYVTVHAGETEVGHFLHALSAWKMYCTARGTTPDPARAKRAFEGYLKHVGEAFAALGDALCE
jgi:hypothetical protein